MTGEDEKGAGKPPRPDTEPPRKREAHGRHEERQPGRVPEPEPEEVPELLGDRSDYPIVWDGEES
jgi:hypothetical protein